MKILISQRVEVIQSYNERRDCLDQAFYAFLTECGHLPIPVPNNADIAKEMFSQIEDIGGILLTGGNDLSEYGGNAPERDATERVLIELAIQHKIPLLGICRGAQMIHCFFGGKLGMVLGHVAVRHDVLFDGCKYNVNSFHNFALTEIPECLEIKAVAEDGVIKAIKHKEHSIMGIMWHPEREAQVQELDKEILNSLLEGRR